MEIRKRSILQAVKLRLPQATFYSVTIHLAVYCLIYIIKEKNVLKKMLCIISIPFNVNTLEGRIVADTF